MKLGKDVFNISLPPGATCVPGVPCHNSMCYAHKAWRQYPNVRMAWGGNLAEFVMDPWGYFAQIREYIWRHGYSRYSRECLSDRSIRRRFRWHVGGDILNQEYLDGMIETAKAFPHVSFLAFTKRYKLDYGRLPKNLSILISAWPGYAIVNVPGPGGRFLPTAWCQDGTEERIPRNAYECPGSCTDCRVCWDTTKDVWFHKH